ncbi:transmembrane protein 272-like [Conger conger]|nr:transmembrane protein 272-like [Conger conger]XP_061103810.1 transmembrane protein 272-like [Conger conger]XP_061103811.1 transmembrane protein 272-like [Conger conger]XP_061103812.1 transmembrane protein 272-like [Conger conger]XP_061103813.1 transmembrane protein 272-like [Conger conger]
MEDRNLLRNFRQAPKPSTPVLVLSKLIMLAIPITQIVLGTIYLDKCPVQPYIPIYVLVSGVFTMVLSLLSCLPCARESEEPQNPLSSICTAWNSLMILFLFCWFIAGNVWIYSVYAPSYDPNDLTQYCHKTLYLFAFWLTTLVYILVGVLLVGGCCALLCMAVCGWSGFGNRFDDDI